MNLKTRRHVHGISSRPTQTVTSFQGTSDQLAQAQQVVEGWGLESGNYQTTAEYQALLRGLQGSFPYRLDTNFAKMDRIVHGEIENFKQRVLDQVVHGHEIREWNRLLYRSSDRQRLRAVGSLLGS